MKTLEINPSITYQIKIKNKRGDIPTFKCISDPLYVSRKLNLFTRLETFVHH